jgi:hypothetical protein
MTSVATPLVTRARSIAPRPASAVRQHGGSKRLLFESRACLSAAQQVRGGTAPAAAAACASCSTCVISCTNTERGCRPCPSSSCSPLLQPPATLAAASSCSCTRTSPQSCSRKQTASINVSRDGVMYARGFTCESRSGTAATAHALHSFSLACAHNAECSATSRRALADAWEEGEERCA